MTMSGSRNKIWRVRDMNTPRRALPIELKKLEVTGWMPLISVTEEWKDGSVKGICARGGFIVDMKWKDGKVTSLYIQSRKGGKTKVCFNGKVKNITLKGGKGIKLL